MAKPLLGATVIEDDEIGDCGFGDTMPSTPGTEHVILRRFIGEMLSSHAIVCRG